jgi:hypothetical protein
MHLVEMQNKLHSFGSVFKSFWNFVAKKWAFGNDTAEICELALIRGWLWLYKHFASSTSSASINQPTIRVNFHRGTGRRQRNRNVSMDVECRLVCLLKSEMEQTDSILISHIHIMEWLCSIFEIENRSFYFLFNWRVKIKWSRSTHYLIREQKQWDHFLILWWGYHISTTFLYDMF